MASTSTDGASESKRRPDKHNMLRTYYVADEKCQLDDDNFDPFDIDNQHFNADLYFDKLLKERSLTELMDRERDVCKEIQSLDSDMQTLVYENYNKFISATDTIRKMKSDFCKMEEEMDHLATKMAVITEFSGKISCTLQDRRKQINKLSGVHKLLHKLNFLFELPTKLTSCIEDREYGQAVRYYSRARQVLEHYQHMPSFKGIHSDCEKIVGQMKVQLREQFQNNEASPKQLAETVDLLLQLNEPAEVLCDEFLSHASKKLNEDLSELSSQIVILENQNSGNVKRSDYENKFSSEQPNDILAFVDHGCNHFLGNMCLIIGAYQDMFMTQPRISESFTGEDVDMIPMRKLMTFVTCHMNEYFGYVGKRVQLESETGDNTILVRALDRFYRRLQAMSKLLPETDFARAGTDIVSQAGKDRCDHYLQALMRHFTECLTDIRQHLVVTRLVSAQQTSGNFMSQLQTTTSSVVEQVRSVLTSLQSFIKPDITFAMKPYFNDKFRKKDVRQGLVVAFLTHIDNVCLQFCEGTCDKSSVPPMLLLILSKLCLDFEASAIGYMMTLTDELFGVDTSGTATAQLCGDAKEVAQKLLDHYVWVQGCMISQMLRKSVDTRDWVSSIEPRNVRAVMKRVVEDVTAIDGQVGQLFEEGLRKARSSDSSRRQFSQSASRLHARSNWSSYGPSTIDDSLLSNINKLFSERIEIFTSVEFSKVSVLTGIIKISLKTFLECVRLRTFGRYGLQQIQVDTHYLQLYLWRFVADENLVHVLLDEILSSAVLRCLDPALMEPSVVDVICERS